MGVSRQFPEIGVPAADEQRVTHPPATVHSFWVTSGASWGLLGHFWAFLGIFGHCSGGQAHPPPPKEDRGPHLGPYETGRRVRPGEGTCRPWERRRIE